MLLMVLAALTLLVAPDHGLEIPMLAPNPGDVLQLTGFGANFTPSLLPPIWDAEGVYEANHSKGVHQWWHSTRPNILLTYEPFTAGPNEPRRWIIVNFGRNRDILSRKKPVAQLPHAGPCPWEHGGGGWQVPDCMGVPREVPARLKAVTDLRRRGGCGTLSWRLVGLETRHPSLLSFASRFWATDDYSSLAPVYRSESGAVLQRAVTDSQSSWVLRSPDDDGSRMAVLDDFADRINLIETERFLVSTLPGQEFRDQPWFICQPDGWERGDADFMLPDLDGYKAINHLADSARWDRRKFTKEDRKLYKLAFGNEPEQHARVMVLQNVSRDELDVTVASLESPWVQLTDSGCAIFRVRNTGFRLTVRLRKEDDSGEVLMEAGSLGGWRDFVVSLPESGIITLTAAQPRSPSDRLAVSQVLVFNETCNQLQGRASSCQSATCQNGGTCFSVTIKHHLCMCPHGFLGADCERKVDCGQPPEIASGALTHLSGTTYLERAYYSCLPGHVLTDTTFGLAWSSCHHNGSWVDIPNCKTLTSMPQPQPLIHCDFGECPGFNTRVDNVYNTDTDIEWQRTKRLNTSNIRPQRYFLVAYRQSGRRSNTARVQLPCLELAVPGCLRLDVHLMNARLWVEDHLSNSVLRLPVKSGRHQLIRLNPSVGPLLIVAQLMAGESEVALDTIGVYRQTCGELDKLIGDDRELPWPSYPTEEQTEQPVNGTDQKAEDTASAGSSGAGRIIIVLTPLVVLLLVMIRPPIC